MASCPWGIASAEHHYCFWNYANDLDVPIPEKDACNLLGITPEQYTETYRSAIAKARLMRNSQVWLDFREAIHEMNKKCEDNTVYVPDKFADFIKELVADPEATEDGLPLPDKPKSKRGRRGKKGKIKRVQLYGLYSQRALKAIHDKKNPKK